MVERSDEPIYLRTSERQLYARCRQAWWWSHIDQLHAIEVASALRFGDLVHQSLGTGVPELGMPPWYKPGVKRGTHPAKSFAAIYDRQVEEGMDTFTVYGEEDEGGTDARTLGISMLERYVDEYGKDEHIRVIAPEMDAQIPVMDKHGEQMYVLGSDRKSHPLIYCLTFDLAFEDMNLGRIGLMETKTTRMASTRHLQLDEQAGSYWTFAPQHPPIVKALTKLGKTDIDFIMYNFLRKAMPDERPMNADGQRLNRPTKDMLLAKCAELGIVIAKSTKVDDLVLALGAKGVDVPQLGEVSKSQPPPFFLRTNVYRDQADRESLMTRIRMVAWEMGQVRAKKIPVYKTIALQWPDQHCNGCQFRDMCELHESGSDWEELRDLTMTSWDPYEAHRDNKGA